MFGLCTLKTESCCCGISLRTGSIIILILNLIGSISVTLNHRHVTNNGVSIGVGQIIILVVKIAALYGVFRKKSDFLIPHLAVTAVFLILILLVIIGLLVLLPFWGKLLREMTYETPDGKMEHLSENIINMMYAIYVFMLLVTIALALIEHHFFKVVLSYYNELKTTLWSINPPPTNGFVA